MSYLQVITINDSEYWDVIVKSFSNYDVSYLSGYVKAFCVHGEGDPLLFYYNDGETRAINVMMVRDIASSDLFSDKLEKGMWFDIASPYGYGGFLIEGYNIDDVNKVYDQYCIEQGFVSEFVRFHLLYDYKSKYNGVVETHTHNIIRNLDITIDEMLLDFEHKVRKNIKKANKFGLNIIIDTDGTNLEDFLNIYYKTMERNEADKQYYFKKDFFEIINSMNKHYAYFYVLYEGQVISTELVLYGSENCYSFLGGTDSNYFDLRPNDYLKFEIIKWAKEKGLKRFILGGGYGKDDGIYKYKKSFAPNGVYDFYIGKKIFNQEKYDYLLNLRNISGKQKEQISYFPQYRG